MLTDMKLVEHLARSAAAKWKTHRLYEDLLQEARLQLWLNYSPSHSHASNVFRVHYRLIDFLRLSTGRKGSKAYERRVHDLLHCNLQEFEAPPIEDECNPIFELGLDQLGGRHEVIIRMLELGFLKRDIANHLGVTPGRVSHLLREIREKVGDLS